MKPKRLSATMGVALVAIAVVVAVAGLSSLGCSGSSSTDNPLDMSGTPQAVESTPAITPMTGNELSGMAADRMTPAEDYSSGQAGKGPPSEAGRVNPTEGGGATATVADPETANQATPSHPLPAADAKRPTGPLDNEPQPPLPGTVPVTAEASIPTPEPATPYHPADLTQAAPANPMALSDSLNGKGEVPPGEAENSPGQTDGTSVVQDSAQQPDGNSADPQAANLPSKKALKYPSLGSYLNQLVAAAEAGQTDPDKAAQGAAIHQGESVAVTIHLSGYLDEMVVFLVNHGGDPRNVGEDYIEAYVPVTLLGQVSEHPGVTRVREIIPPQSG